MKELFARVSQSCVGAPTYSHPMPPLHLEVRVALADVVVYPIYKAYFGSQPGCARCGDEGVSVLFHCLPADAF